MSGSVSFVSPQMRARGSQPELQTAYPSASLSWQSGAHIVLSVSIIPLQLLSILSQSSDVPGLTVASASLQSPQGCNEDPPQVDITFC